MVSGRGLISIWFFVGAILLAYGALILGAGIYELSHPPQRPVVLANLHANIWWGALLLAMGAFYVWRFAPWRPK
jgi:hypothetical protein